MPDSCPYSHRHPSSKHLQSKKLNFDQSRHLVYEDWSYHRPTGFGIDQVTTVTWRTSHSEVPFTAGGLGAAQGPQKLWGNWCKILHSGHFLELFLFFKLFFFLTETLAIHTFLLIWWCKSQPFCGSNYFLVH